MWPGSVSSQRMTDIGTACKSGFQSDVRDKHGGSRSVGRMPLRMRPTVAMLIGSSLSSIMADASISPQSIRHCAMNTMPGVQPFSADPVQSISNLRERPNQLCIVDALTLSTTLSSLKIGTIHQRNKMLMPQMRHGFHVVEQP